MTLLLWINFLLQLASATSLELLPIQNEMATAASTRIGSRGWDFTTTLLVASIHVNFTSKKPN